MASAKGGPLKLTGHATLPVDDRGIDALVEFAYRYKAAWTDWPLDYTDLRTGQKAGVRFNNVHQLKEFLLKYRADAEIYLRRKQREHELEQRLAQARPTDAGMRRRRLPGRSRLRSSLAILSACTGFYLRSTTSGQACSWQPSSADSATTN